MPDRDRVSSCDTSRPARLVGWIASAATAFASTLSGQGIAIADPILRLPMDCVVGRTCFIQNYVDHDPSEGIKDYRCGARTYNGHNGTDIRLPSMKDQRQGVHVLAAAEGRVLRMRDGVADVSIRVAGRASVAGRECGNGLVIDHGGGWTTQYCHMANGTLTIKPGDRVAAGQPLGLVGLSGETEFPHLHLTVRRDDRVVDPFAVDVQPGSCGGGTPLWDEPSQKAMAYRAGEVINRGFSDRPLTLEAIENDEQHPEKPTPRAAALVAYVLTIGLERGDQQTLRILDPNGKLFSEYVAAPLDHDKAQAFVMTGRKRHNDPWPTGTYRATYRVQRAGATVIIASFDLQL